MLILQRKKGQSIVISDNITVQVIEITQDGVRLAIDAPKEVKILRQELIEAADANKMASVKKEQIDTIKQLIKNNKSNKTDK